MAHSRPTGQVDRQVNSLADLDLSAEGLDSILGHIGRLGVEVLGGWDAAATTLVERGQVATFGITDDRVKKIDQYQYDSGKGPCVYALGGDIQYFGGREDRPEWRQFAEVAGSEGFYSVASFPLKLNDEVIGALNFYSGERDALRPGQREEGNAFAAQAAVSLSNAREFSKQAEEIEQLNQALESRTMIGQATGLLMAQEGLSSDEAFQRLVSISQNANLKLRDIAKRYVHAWESREASSDTRGGRSSTS